MSDTEHEHNWQVRALRAESTLAKLYSEACAALRCPEGEGTGLDWGNLLGADSEPTPCPHRVALERRLGIVSPIAARCQRGPAAGSGAAAGLLLLLVAALLVVVVLLVAYAGGL